MLESSTKWSEMRGKETEDDKLKATLNDHQNIQVNLMEVISKTQGTILTRLNELETSVKKKAYAKSVHSLS